MTVFDPRDFRIVGHENDNAVTSSTAFNPTEAADTRVMQVTSHGGDARWKGDGNTPTSTSGERITDGQSIIIWDSEEITKFRVIAISGVVEIDIIYYKGATS